MAACHCLLVPVQCAFDCHWGQKFAAFKILSFVFSVVVLLFASLSASLCVSICHIFSSSFSFSFASVRAQSNMISSLSFVHCFGWLTKG